MKSLQKVFDLKRHLGKVYLTGLQKSCAISFAVKCFFFLIHLFLQWYFTRLRCAVRKYERFFFVFDVVVFSILFCYVTTFFSSWALNARENRAFFSSVRRWKIEREKTAHRQIITSNNGLFFLSCELAFLFCSVRL